ncbi:F0F1 ATP synthase subunit A [Tepidibacter formicigenes]|jgi:F-type H+-transporting ATPase subunit a|uniref:ATP synthase subunit a n=1 Tax=Tepidibacter formicigenes DSM 15518 TaxID=1123349 RepID=A0A1M6MR02_9FIRM|nr:F0F1 ATP synthase subunit A [Tepidibacter formicigenes]SHJ85826.1 ATP synthase F0 subcomplex A subunit [Tepidibacter formicigenes DSM 15518]
MTGPKIMFTIPGLGIPVSETVTTTWIIMIGLTLFAYFGTRKLEKVPKGFQNFVELIVDGLYSVVKQTMGEDKMRFAPYIGSLFLFFVCSNLIGLLGLRSPTTDLNTTLAWALITFFMVQYNGIKSKGLGGYLKGFLEPIPAMLPLNIVGELANPVSLSFRPFGNITGGMVIMMLLYQLLAYLSGLIGIGIPILEVGIPAVLHIYFDLFSGVLQAFIFIMLTMVFISGAIDE